ncbi:c-type cytochrome [Flavobacterium sp. M31R6]|uniref:c-type cytochrome n=1 Tax=Flavobacterium sp. M31R6 TaxID=2739062 RepID=UPI00156A4D03|nr:c-type cytochrome [Flavobacterium sp. M31R6]QKJ62039.1 c-type cytochrome [Flavobacterium sp. M31R6]
MKKALFLFAVLAFLSCKKKSQEPFGKPTENTTEVQTPEALGKEIFEGKGNCVACHQVDQKVIGPSIKEIAKIYKEKNGNMIGFLKGEGEAIVDPAQFPVMQANLEITKAFTEEEQKAVEAYINSNLK